MRIRATWVLGFVAVGALSCSSESEDGGSTASCPPGQLLCGATCVYPVNDVVNCGACDVACQPGQLCVSGACACAEGRSACGAGCVDLQSDPANCGACAIACDASQVCTLGACAGSCAAGLEQCGQACVDVASSPEHCGACNVTCPVGQACSAGSCGCSAGQQLCADQCVDPLSNPLHCGTCGIACPSGACAQGACTDTPVGTGGSSGAGGTGGSTGGTGGTGGVNDFVIGDDGYVTTGDWQGYPWTSVLGTGTTVDPADFSGHAPGDPLCVSGVVGADPNWGGVVTVGFNLNQAEGTGNSAGTVTPTGDGLLIDLSNNGGNQLRVQIAGADGGAGDARWCANISGSGGFVPFSEFNTQCWDNSGEFYAGEPLSGVMILVPGHNTDDTSYDFCINSITESGGGGGTGGTGGTAGTGGVPATGGTGGTPSPCGSGFGSPTMVGSGSSTDRWARGLVSRDGVNFTFIANGWGDGWQSHNMSWNGSSFTVVDYQGQDMSGIPSGYPTMFCGLYADIQSGACGLPLALDSIDRVCTGWKWQAGSGSDHNSAFDIWFSNGSTDRSGMMMVWLRDPPGQHPSGSLVEANVVIPGVPGTWDFWAGWHGSLANVTYTRAEGQDTHEIEFDVMAFVRDLQTRPEMPPADTLAAVSIGFEIWDGPITNLVSEDFYVQAVAR